VESSCEGASDSSGSIKMLDNDRVVTQLVGSRVVLGSTEFFILFF
jgi:hypothetical protein